MNIIIKTYESESSDLIYPILLKYDNEKGDIILATRSDGDFVDGIVLTNNNELQGFGIGSVWEREFSKKLFKPFHGEIVLSN